MYCISTTPNTTKFFLSFSNLYSNLIWNEKVHHRYILKEPNKLELRFTFLFLGSLFQRRQVAKLVLWPQIHSLEYSWRLWSQRRKSSMKQKQKKTKQKRIVSIRFAFTKNLLMWDWSHLHVYFNSSSIYYTYKFFIKTKQKINISTSFNILFQTII